MSQALETHVPEIRARRPGLRAVAPDAPGLVHPVLSIGTITACDGFAAVSGSVSKPFVDGDLIVNGRLVPINGDGSFSAIVGLRGFEGLALRLDAGAHGTAELNVSLNAA
jgi:hypothetical protein